MPPEVPAAVQGIEVRDVEAAHLRQAVFTALGFPAAVMLETLPKSFRHVHERRGAERERREPPGIFGEQRLGLVGTVLVVELADLGVDFLQPHALDVAFEHIGKGFRIGVLLLVFTEGLQQLDGIIIALKGLRERGIRRRRLVGAVVVGDDLLNFLEAAVRQVLLAHVLCHHAAQGVVAQGGGIELVEKLRRQRIDGCIFHGRLLLSASSRRKR